jgi:hypothetical protein
MYERVDDGLVYYGVVQGTGKGRQEQCREKTVIGQIGYRSCALARGKRKRGKGKGKVSEKAEDPLIHEHRKTYN